MSTFPPPHHLNPIAGFWVWGLPPDNITADITIMIGLFMLGVYVGIAVTAWRKRKRGPF